jgi:hypothetical protein
MYVYFVFFTTFGNRIKIKGPVSSSTNSFSSMQFRQCSLSIFKQYSNPSLLQSCRRGFIILEPLFFKYNNMIDIYKLINNKYIQFKNMNYIPIPIPPYFIREIITFIMEQFQKPSNHKNDTSKKRKRENHNNNIIRSHPLKKQKQNSISKRICDQIVCGTFRVAFGTAYSSSKYKPYVRGKFIYVPNPANDDVYSNISQSRGAGVLKFVILAILAVFQYYSGGMLTATGIAGMYGHHQLNQGYNHFVKFIKMIDQKKDQLFGLSSVHSNQIGRVNLAVVHVYLSSLFSLISLGSQVEDFNTIYCKFLFEFQYIPFSMFSLSTAPYQIRQILHPIEKFIDSLITSNFAKRKNNKLSVNKNYYLDFKRKHLINLYTNYIKLVYIYVYNEATISSALIEFPIQSFNPYASMRSLKLPNDQKQKVKDIVTGYVLYKTGRVNARNGAEYKQRFDKHVRQIISIKHGDFSQKLIKTTMNILGKLVPVKRIIH